VAARSTAADEAKAAGGARRPVGEIVFALALLALILSVFVQALPLSIVQDDGTVGPGLFPMVLSVLMIAMVGGFLVSLFVRAGPAVQEKQAGEPVVTRDQLMMVGLLVLATLVGGYVGLLAVAGVLLLAGLVFIERVGWRSAILFTLGTLVGVYLVFDFWLGMDVGLRGLFR